MKTSPSERRMVNVLYAAIDKYKDLIDEGENITGLLLSARAKIHKMSKPEYSEALSHFEVRVKKEFGEITLIV